MKRFRREDASRLSLSGPGSRRTVAHNAGCDRCRESGRLVVAELVVATPALRRAIEKVAGSQQLRDALAADHRNLRDALLQLVFEGEITPEEAAGVLP